MQQVNHSFADILESGREIARIKDLDVLLERILTEARTFTSADAGSIYLREGDALRFSYTQNDTLQAKLAPRKKLIYSTFSIPITSRSIAGYVAGTGETVNIPDAYDIPETVTYCFDKSFDEASGYRTRSMLTFPIRSHRGEVTGVLQLINARDKSGGVISFGAEAEPLVSHFAETAAVAIERAQMTRAIIMRMISMSALRDPRETGAHVNRVAAYAVEIYEQWARMNGMDTDQIQRDRDSLRMGAMLHDVGKIAISDAILKKPARLDPEEVRAMQQHTYLGAQLFEEQFSDFDEASYVIALEHHEKWDGSGYPGHVNPMTGQPLPGCAAAEGGAQGKKGEEIHPFGRVVAIADVYDALSTRRSYKEAWDEDRVLETLRADSGTHFDPGMIDAFFESFEVIRSISERYPG
jgi:HD-GYP domain-containing protein (c-di-GMP phosphodiesterase class II)